MIKIEEQYFTCPYCYSKISMLIEAMSDKQEYIEDCEVCCRPIVIEFSLLDEGEISFRARSANE